VATHWNDSIFNQKRVLLTFGKGPSPQALAVPKPEIVEAMEKWRAAVMSALLDSGSAACPTSPAVPVAPTAQTSEPHTHSTEDALGTPASGADSTRALQSKRKALPAEGGHVSDSAASTRPQKRRLKPQPVEHPLATAGASTPASSSSSAAPRQAKRKRGIIDAAVHDESKTAPPEFQPGWRACPTPAFEAVARALNAKTSCTIHTHCVTCHSAHPDPVSQRVPGGAALSAVVHRLLDPYGLHPSSPQTAILAQQLETELMSAPRAETQMTLCTAELAALYCVLSGARDIRQQSVSYMPDIVVTADRLQIAQSHAATVRRLHDFGHESDPNRRHSPLLAALDAYSRNALDSVGMFRTTLFGLCEGRPVWIDLSEQSLPHEGVDYVSHILAGTCLCCGINAAPADQPALAPGSLQRALFDRSPVSQDTHWTSLQHGLVCPLVLAALPYLASTQRNKVREIVALH